MSFLNSVRKKECQLLIKSEGLRKLSGVDTSFKVSQEIREEQEKAYKKWLFYKNFLEAINKTNKKEID